MKILLGWKSNHTSSPSSFQLHKGLNNRGVGNLSSLQRKQKTLLKSLTGYIPIHKFLYRALNHLRSGPVIRHSEATVEEPMFQSSAQSFTCTWNPPQILSPGRCNSKRQCSIRLGGIRGYLERPAGWSSSAYQGISDPGSTQSGQGPGVSLNSNRRVSVT